MPNLKNIMQKNQIGSLWNLVWNPLYSTVYSVSQWRNIYIPVLQAPAAQQHNKLVASPPPIPRPVPGSYVWIIKHFTSLYIHPPLVIRVMMWEIEGSRNSDCYIIERTVVISSLINVVQWTFSAGKLIYELICNISCWYHIRFILWRKERF